MITFSVPEFPTKMLMENERLFWSILRNCHTQNATSSGIPISVANTHPDSGSRGDADVVVDVSDGTMEQDMVDADGYVLHYSMSTSSYDDEQADQPQLAYVEALVHHTTRRDDGVPHVDVVVRHSAMVVEGRDRDDLPGDDWCRNGYYRPSRNDVLVGCTVPMPTMMVDKTPAVAGDRQRDAISDAMEENWDSMKP